MSHSSVKRKSHLSGWGVVAMTCSPKKGRGGNRATRPPAMSTTRGGTAQPDALTVEGRERRTRERGCSPGLRAPPHPLRGHSPPSGCGPAGRVPMSGPCNAAWTGPLLGAGDSLLARFRFRSHAGGLDPSCGSSLLRRYCRGPPPSRASGVRRSTLGSHWGLPSTRQPAHGSFEASPRGR